MEVLEALARNDPPIQAGPIRIAPGDHRRNLTVRGVPLGHLVGKRFRVGDVVLIGGRLNYPCKYLEKLLGLPVYLPLYNRSGLNCRIERGGTIHRGMPSSRSTIEQEAGRVSRWRNPRCHAAAALRLRAASFTASMISG